MDDSAYMRLAIAQAREAMGKTHPNPAVGAIITQDGEVVAEGHTQPVGEDHAEIVALNAYRAAGLHPNDTTSLYVTLEPCSTHGRTPPCTRAIIDSGIRRVVIGATDPNPKHDGAGFGILEKEGLIVQKGILAEECEDLNLIFNWVMKSGGPLFAGKIATTIDGRIATRGGSSKWITSEMARENVHFWRNYFPAIAVGAGTIITDNPSLTIRKNGEDDRCPVRFVFDRNLITFTEGTPKVYCDKWKDRTIVVSNQVHKERTEQLAKELGIRFWLINDTLGDDGLSEFAEKCHQEGIGGVYIEGGARLLSSFVQFKKLHYLFAYRAPKLLADRSALAPFLGMDPATMQDAIQLENVHHGQFGDDQLMRGFVVYPNIDGC